MASSNIDFTRDELIGQIPKNGEPSFNPTGRRIGSSWTDSELGRNVANTLSSLPGVGGVASRAGGVAARTAGRGLSTDRVIPAAWELVDEGGALAKTGSNAAQRLGQIGQSAGSALSRVGSVAPEASALPGPGGVAQMLGAPAKAGPLVQATNAMPHLSVGAQTAAMASPAAGQAARALGAVPGLVKAGAAAAGVGGAAIIGAGLDRPAVANSGSSPSGGNPSDASNAGAGRGYINPAAAVPDSSVSAPPPPPPDSDLSAQPSSSNVSRVGNSYSGENIRGDITINGQSPRGALTSLPSGAAVPSAFSGMPGMEGISAMNMAAADGLDARSRLESLGRLMASGQIQMPQAGPSMAMSGDTFGIRRARPIVASELGAQRAFDYSQGNDPASRRRNAEFMLGAMQEQSAMQRARIADAGADRRTAVQELGHLQRQQIASQATVDAANARSQAPAGYRYTADGSLTHIPGGPADPTVRGSRAPLNDTQAKALQFGTRMQEAGKNLDQLAAEGVDQPSLLRRMAGDGAMGSLANLTQSPAQQQVEQSQRDFINAVLRRESGAAIADTEFNNARKQYFPQVGDSPEVIAQKRQNREIATAGIMAEVPDADKRVGQVLSAAQKSASPTQGQAAGQPKPDRSITRSGSVNGRRVVQYSDGSVEYAN